MKKSELSKYMSKLGKLSQKKNPKTKEYFSKLGKKSAKSRKANKL